MLKYFFWSFVFSLAVGLAVVYFSEILQYLIWEKIVAKVRKDAITERSEKICHCGIRGCEEHRKDAMSEELKPLARTFDARTWAKSFNETLVELGYQPHDEGWLIGWFANAIMCGYDEAKSRSSPPELSVEEIIKIIRESTKLWNKRFEESEKNGDHIEDVDWYIAQAIFDRLEKRG